MRLTSNKIEHLAGRLLHLCQLNRQVHVTGSADLVIRTIEDVIFANMRGEEEIEDQVDVLIQKHKSEIQTLEMDLGSLRNKFKREIAKKQGFVL